MFKITDDDDKLHVFVLLFLLFRAACVSVSTAELFTKPLLLIPMKTCEDNKGQICQCVGGNIFAGMLKNKF